MTVEIREYQLPDGQSPFGRWFGEVNARAAAKITSAIDKIGRGLMSNVESVGGGVSEIKIDFGQGFRVYFGFETDGRATTIVILLNGGTKKRQSKDIDRAKAYWKDYKTRRHQGER